MRSAIQSIPITKTRSPGTLLQLVVATNLFLLTIMMSGVVILPSEVIYSLSIQGTRTWLFEVYRAIRVASALVIALHIPVLSRGAKDFPFLVGGTLALILSTVWSTAAYVTFNAGINILIVIAVAYIAVRQLEGPRALKVAWLAIGSIIVTSAALAASGNTYALMPNSDLWRGLYPHKNSFGPVCGAFIVLTLSTRKFINISNPVACIFILISTISLLASGSAGAISATTIGAFLALNYQSLLKLKISRPQIFPVVMGLIALACSVMIFLTPTIIGALGRDLTLTGRTALWSAVLPLSVSHPFGTGYGTAGGQAAMELIGQRTQSIYRAIDSGYLVFALDMGWLAVAVYVFAMISLIIPSVKRGRLGSALAGLAALQIFIAVSEKTGGPYPSAGLFFIVLALIAAREARLPNS